MARAGVQVWRGESVFSYLVCLPLLLLASPTILPFALLVALLICLGLVLLLLSDPAEFAFILACFFTFLGCFLFTEAVLLFLLSLKIVFFCEFLVLRLMSEPLLLALVALAHGRRTGCMLGWKVTGSNISSAMSFSNVHSSYFLWGTSLVISLSMWPSLRG